MRPRSPRNRRWLTAVLGLGAMAAGAALASQHPVARWRAEQQLRKVAAPRTITRFMREHVFAGQLVCGELEYEEASPGLRRRRFTFDLNDGGVWIQGRPNEIQKRWLYGNLDRQVWTHCMDPTDAAP